MKVKESNRGKRTQAKFDRLAHLEDVVGNRSAFAGCTDLKSVVIPEGVKFIGDFAFADCTNLSCVVLPSSVRLIGRGAFCGCARLKSVTIPKGGLSMIGDGAFCGTPLLEDTTRDGVAICDGWVIGRNGCPSELTLPRGIRGIADGAFAGCVELMSVTIPNGVKSIPFHAFSGCKNLKSVVISEGVVSICSSAFHDCWQLASVSIPASVRLIDSSAFERTALVWNVETGVAVCDGWVVGSNARCPAQLTLPKGIRGIAAEAFKRRGGFVITIPKGMRTIPERAFFNENGLQVVVISEGVDLIGSAAFYGCSQLKMVEFEGLPPRVDGCIEFPKGAMGVYRPKYASSWEAVLDKGGKWKGLKMRMSEKVRIEWK